ncbi:MAG: hypothetical protein ACRDFY_07415 [Candidatus Limnocylindria bacterium]
MARQTSGAEIEYPFWTAMTLYEHATWLRDQRRAADAAPFAAEARQVFEGLAAEPWVERVDALGLAAPTGAVSSS